MRTTTLLFGLSVVAAATTGCSNSKSDSSSKAQPSKTVPATDKAAPATAEPKLPSGGGAPVKATFDPYLQGFCEVTIDGGAPTKTGGGVSNISTRHWAGPQTKNPSWGLLMNCGNISISSGGPDEKFELKPATYTVGGKDDEPHVTVMSPLMGAQGQLVIEAWDMNGIKGSFELTGQLDGKAATAKGVFDFQCPYTPPGQPCLDKPTSPPP